MNHFQRKVHKYIKDEFDINEQIDFFDEQHEEQVEIEKDNWMIRIDMIATSRLDQETGGEDDEILLVMKDKQIEIQKIELWHTVIKTSEDLEIEVDEFFKNKLETLLNKQIYND